MNESEKRVVLFKDFEDVHKELLTNVDDVARLEVRESKAAKDRVVASINKVKMKLDEIKEKL